MYYVYGLSSLHHNYIYVGLTDNIERRVAQHQKGYNKTTRPYRPFRLIYLRDFQIRPEARLHEKYLKSGIGKEFLRRIKDSGKEDLGAGLSTDR